MTRTWHGPRPTALQRHLLDACLDPDGTRAAEAWRTWRSRCDFDEEDPASHELASLAAMRLGTEAAGAAESARSLGWHRRAWYLSELAADAAKRLGSACRERGFMAIALGDVAASLRGVMFAGRRLPIRSIEVLVPGIDRATRLELLEVAASGPVGDAIRGHRLSCVVLEATQDRFADRACGANPDDGVLAVPSLGSMLARLAARNWCWNPPDRLRWMVEAMSILESHPEPSRLGAEMRDALAAAEAGRSAELALKSVRSIVPFGTPVDRLDVAIEAAASVRGGARAWLRAWVRQKSPEAATVRLHRTLGRWRRSLGGDR